MLKNYIKIAFRNLLKNKIYSVLNILGLSIGMVCTILLFLYVQDELSYDKQHPFAENTYRVASNYHMMGQKYEMAVTPAPMAHVLKEEFPEVIKTVRFRQMGSSIVNYKNSSFKEDKTVFVDNSIFDVFAVKLKIGNKQTALAEPNTVAISESIAKKYFGDADPMGKVLKIANKYDYEVTGVFEDIAPNIHFNFDILFSLESLDESKETFWFNNNFQTYIVLKDNATKESVEAKFGSIIEKYMKPEIEKMMGVPLEKIDKDQLSASFYLQSLTSIHLYSDLQVELGPNGDIQYVYIFSLIAAFILFIATINFVNISTARSAKRAKEVGVRKVLGSNKKELILQFISESMLVTIFSLLISIVFVNIVLASFNGFSGKSLSFNLFQNPLLIALLFLLVIIVGVLAGSYPAFILASYKSVSVLSGKVKNATKNGLLRSGLVIFQFTIAIIMIISTVMVYKQLNFIQNKKLGFDKEQIVIVRDAYLLGNNIKTMKSEVLNYPEVVNATISSYLPVPSDYNNSAIFPIGRKTEQVAVQQWRVDYDYIKTMKMKIIEGRDFSKEFGNEEQNVIINEATVKQFGFDNPLDQKLMRYINNEGETIAMTVVGVVEDFHFESLRNKISPLIMYIGESDGAISIKVSTGDMAQFITKLNNKWSELAPNQPFTYSFMDESFNEMYFAEQKIGNIFGLFAGLSIFIACLGLFGLSAFTAEVKTKEIGIRKVLGASISGIVIMLSKEFVKLVGISFIIAAPIAYYFMQNWLQDFVYKTDLSPWLFFMSGLIAITISIITISYHAYKAASLDPAKSIKYE